MIRATSWALAAFIVTSFNHSTAGSLADPLNLVVTKSIDGPVKNVVQPTVTISRAQIEESGADSLAELLRVNGAVSITQNYSGSNRGGVVSLRGFGENSAQNILILIDGVALNSPTLQAPNLSLVELDQIKKVEIYKSGATVLFGPGAVGGAVNVLTYDADVTRVRASHTSFGGKSANSTFSKQLSPTVSIRADLSSHQSDGFRRNSKELSSNTKIALNADGLNHGASITHSQTRNDRRDPGALYQSAYDLNRFDSTTLNDFTNIDTDITQIKASYLISESVAVDAALSRKVAKKNGYFYGALTDNLKQYEFQHRVRGSNLIAGTSNEWVLGTTLSYSSYDGSNSLGSTNSAQKINSWFARNIVRLSGSTTAEAGIRRTGIDESDKITASDYSDSIFGSELGIRWEPIDGTELFARIENGGRFANIDENAVTPNGVEFLKPQQNQSREIGIIRTLDRFQWSLSVYEIATKNEIIYDASSYVNDNMDESKRSGADLDVSFTPNPQLTFGGRATYIDSELTSGGFAGNTVPYVPNWEGAGYLNYRFNSEWSAFANYMYTGERYRAGDDANNFKKLGPNRQVDINAVWHREKLRISFGVKNLLDRENIAFAGTYGSPSTHYFYASAPRSWSLRMDYTF